MNNKLVEMLQKEREAIVSKIANLELDLISIDAVILIQKRDKTEVEDTGLDNLCSYFNCDAERDTDPKYKGSLCSNHREKQIRYNAAAMKRAKNKKKVKKDIVPEVDMKIHKPIEVVKSPTKEEVADLIKQAKVNEAKAAHWG